MNCSNTCMSSPLSRAHDLGFTETIRHISVANPNYYDISFFLFLYHVVGIPSEGSLDPSPFPKRDDLRQEAVGLVPRPSHVP